MSKSIPQGSAESTDEFWEPQIPISTDNARGGSAPGVTEGGVSRQVDGRATPRDIEIALTYGLELARCGAMLVGVDGCLQLANRAALAILDKKDGISLERTGLAAERASDTRLLHQLLRDAINAPQSGEPKGSPIMLPRKIARTALIVRVVPGPGLDCWPGTENRAALLTLYDEDKGVDIDEVHLQRHGRLAGPCHRVGDVVVFDVQKNTAAAGADAAHQFRAFLGEELQADFEETQMGLHLVHPLLGPFPAVDVQGQHQALLVGLQFGEH